MRRRSTYTAEGDDVPDGDHAAVLDETEQDAVISDLLRDASQARQLYLLLAVMLNLAATFVPFGATSPVPAVAVRLSSLCIAARFALSALDYKPCDRSSIDTILAVAPSLNCLHAVYSNGADRASLVCAVPIVSHVAGVLFEREGENLVRDARELENLKYTAPGA